MIRIKAVDAQNILDVCELTTNQDGIGRTLEGHSCCNAISIAETKYHPEMHPNAIYNNNVLIGFFMYIRTENQAETATICSFRVEDRIQQKGLEEEAIEDVLRGLKIQGVKKVIFMIDEENKIAKKLCLSFGFRFTGKIDHDEYCYELVL
mgnify:FL=1